MVGLLFQNYVMSTLKLPLHMALDDNADYGNYELPNDYYMELAAADDFGKCCPFRKGELVHLWRMRVPADLTARKGKFVNGWKMSGLGPC